MIHIADIINRKADHIIVWKDENGWHTEDWGNDNLLPVYGDLADVLAKAAHDLSKLRVKLVIKLDR